jgi:hypothetical protein
LSSSLVNQNEQRRIDHDDRLKDDDQEDRFRAKIADTMRPRSVF